MNNLSRAIVIVCLLCPSRLAAQAAPYYQSHFPPEEFKARWERIFDRLGTNGVAIVQGMAQVNGLLVDLRGMPREAQEIGFHKGMIPYIPADRE